VAGSYDYRRKDMGNSENARLTRRKELSEFLQVRSLVHENPCVKMMHGTSPDASSGW